MFNFIYFAISIFAFLSPIIFAGKFLDWHLRKDGQERAKDVIGELYLSASYGQLFSSYCKLMLAALNRNAIVIYAIFLASFYIAAFLIHYFLFRNFNLSGFLFERYLSISFALSLLGFVDIYATKRAVALAARGWYKSSFLVSTLVIYVLLSISGAVLATFLIKGDFNFDFYTKFFANRLWILLQGPSGSSMKIESLRGYYVYISAFAYPAVVLSSSTIVAGAAIAIFSSRIFQPLLDYFADRILSNDEKSIYQKIATLFCTILSILLAIGCWIYLY